MMSRILMICPDFKPSFGGEAELAQALALEFREADHLNAVVAPLVSEEFRETPLLEDRVHRILQYDQKGQAGSFSSAARNATAIIRGIGALTFLTRRLNPSCCLLTTYSTWAALSLLLWRGRFSIFFHGEDLIWILERGGVSLWLLRQACARADRLFFNSRYSREIISRVNSSLKGKSHVVGCGLKVGGLPIVSPEERKSIRRRMGLEPEVKQLLTVCSLNTRKGVDNVIRALPLLLRRISDVRYVVVGDGPGKAESRSAGRPVGGTRARPLYRTGFRLIEV